MKNLFPAQSLSRADYLLGGGLLLACSLLFFHPDIQIVGLDSLNYLFGSPLDFYENCKRIQGGGQHMRNTPYPPPVYALFALWLYPFKLLGQLSSPYAFPPYLVYWLKTLTTLAYAGSGVLFYRISAHYSDDRAWRRFATAIWLASPLALFSQFIFSQYDIFYVVLTLAGLLMFLRGAVLRAALLFGLAITFKYFPAFVFLPLLLLFEKRVARLALAGFIFVVPTLCIQALYGHSPAFIEGVNHHVGIDLIFAAFIDVGGWRIYYLFAAFALLCGVAYLAQVAQAQLARVAAYVYLAGAIFPFLFIVWHPQWTLFFAPAIALTGALDRRHARFLALDLAGMALFVAAVSLGFVHNVDTVMFRGALLGLPLQPSFPMGRLFYWFQQHSVHVFLSGFWAYLVLQLIMKFGPALREQAAPTADSVDYDLVRQRFYLGLLLFLVPAALALAHDW